MLSQRGLEAFLAVMTTGSVSAAASELAVSQPAVSRLVRDLEAATGLRLFDRVGNRVTPTDAARALAAEVERAFVGLSEIEAAVREIRRGRRDRLLIAAMPALSTTILADVVADLARDGERPEIEITSARTQSVVRLVARRQALLGFVAPVGETAEIRVLASERVPLRCIMRADHQLAERARITLTDLAERDLIAYSSTTMTGAALDRAFARLEKPPRIVARATLSPVIASLTLRGLGIGIVDAFTACDHAARGGVVRPIEMAESFGFSVIAARVGRLPPIADAFLARLGERVALDAGDSA